MTTEALADPTKGELPATEFPEDEFPDPSQDPTIEVGPDGEIEVGG